ncbi:HNH endonuclease signature motif containing protein [Citricoccus sp. NR2]|uniref:HNH endonuclease signature motif containing protein n=1 Tax=Citricoccus sp. NR2 TaxID=3004095 RepID=UPI0022DE7D52|nr:HNH endonuclease signature motif containing protein [Citricoccus sp. NR2]WBL19256.1 HNH endonuclease signature motif containing protein [Citricoccus sp. NR2]
MTSVVSSPLLPLLDALDDLSTADLTILLTQGLTTLSRRLSSAHAHDEFSPFHREGADTRQDWGTSFLPNEHGHYTTQGNNDADAIICEDPAASLPSMIEQAAVLGRLCENVETALAGIVGRIFPLHEQRLELLGLPTGRVTHKNAADYLRFQTQVGFGVARRRIQTATAIHPDTTLTSLTDAAGTTTEPPRPDVHDAAVDGEITPRAVQAIIDALGAVEEEARSVSTDPDEVKKLINDGEKTFVTQAREFDDNAFAAYAAGWKERTSNQVNPDGEAPDDTIAEKKRGLRRIGTRGKLNIWQCATDQAGDELFRTLVHAMNNPRATPGSHSGDTTTSDAGTRTQAGADPSVAEGAETTHAVDATGTPVDNLDERTRDQKAHDALIGVLTAGLKVPHNTLPDQGGTRPQMLVTLDLPLLLRMMHQADIAPKNLDPAWLTDGTLPRFELCQGSYTGPISPTAIRHLLCEAEILPVVLGGAGQILDVGTSERFFDKHLRKALVARDGGCAAPGCMAPAPWCESHHIDPARNQGPTSTANGVLLCHHDHRLADRGDWQIRIVDDVPWFTAPPYIDPDQVPRRNTYWRPERQ